jgi:hypothetical protein
MCDPSRWGQLVELHHVHLVELCVYVRDWIPHKVYVDMTVLALNLTVVSVQVKARTDTQQTAQHSVVFAERFKLGIIFNQPVDRNFLAHGLILRCV